MLKISSFFPGPATLHKRHEDGKIETCEVTFRPPLACADTGEVNESHICAGDETSIAIKVGST